MSTDRNHSPLTPAVAAKMDRVLSHLPGLSRTVIELKFGLDGGHPLPRTDIAQQLSLSVGEVRDIETRALDRLRQVTDPRQLTALLARLDR